MCPCRLSKRTFSHCESRGLAHDSTGHLESKMMPATLAIRCGAIVLLVATSKVFSNYACADSLSRSIPSENHFPPYLHE